MSELTRIPNVTVSSTPPIAPLECDLWWNSNIGVFFVYYDDGNTTQWVTTQPVKNVVIESFTVPASGDLEGFYPGPTIKSGVTLLNAHMATPPLGDEDTSLANTKFVQDAIRYAATPAPPNTEYVVDTVADLRLLVARPLAVRTRCYDTIGDRGGGSWSWVPGDTMPDNGITVVSPAGAALGRYKRTYSGSKSARWGGCKCDGATDDTVALQAIMDLGGDIEFDGNMVLSSVTATVDRTCLRGLGGAKIISKAASVGTLLVLDCDNAVVEGVDFEALNSPVLSADIKIIGYGCRIRNCNFYGQLYNPESPYVVPGPTRAIDLGGTGSPSTGYESLREVWMENVYITGGYNGMYAGGLIRCNFTNVMVYYCYGLGMGIGSGISTYDVNVVNYTGIGCGIYAFSTGGPNSPASSYDPSPIYGVHVDNIRVENSGWMRYFAGVNGNVGGTTGGIDIVNQGMNGFRLTGSGKDCAGGGMELKSGAQLGYDFTLVTATAATVPPSNVLTFAATGSLMYVGMLATGTNIPLDAKVVSFTANTVALSRNVTSTVAIGTSVKFTVDIQPWGHRNALVDFSYVSHQDNPPQRGVEIYMEAEGAPSGFTNHHYHRIYAVTEQAPPWRGQTRQRMWDVVSYPRTDITPTNPGVLLRTAGGSGPYISTTVTIADTAGIVAGMTVWGTNIIPNTVVFSVTPGTPGTIVLNNAPIGTGIASSAVLTFQTLLLWLNMGLGIGTPGFEGVTGQTPPPTTGNHVVLNAGSAVGGYAGAITVDNTAGAVVGMRVWGTNIPDGAVIASVTGTTNGTITVSPAQTANFPANENMIVTTYHNDGGMRWVCLGEDTSGNSFQNFGFKTYGCSDMTIDIDSNGNGFGFWASSDGGSDNTYNNLKVRPRIRDSLYGISLVGTGTFENVTFESGDVEARSVAFYLTNTGHTFAQIMGGRYRNYGPTSQQALRLGGGTANQIRLDGGVTFLSNLNALSVTAGDHNIYCGAATFQGATGGGPPISISGGSGVIDWGNAIVFNGNPASNPGYQITGGTMTTQGRLLRQDMTTAPISSTRGNVGEYMVLKTPTATEWGYYCQAVVTPFSNVTWKKLGLT